MRPINIPLSMKVISESVFSNQWLPSKSSLMTDLLITDLLTH
jgi:hypothetical protein